jgi:hypothetical protein
MIVFEVIGELLARIFVEIIFKGIILGTLNFLNKGLNFIWYKITGKKKSENKTNSKAQLKKQLLYKKIELTENLNTILRKGQQGVVLEIIDKDTVFAEFYDHNKKQIEVDNELVFKVGIKQFRLNK